LVALSRREFRAGDNRLAPGDKIDLRGRDREQISLLDPAIRHPAARRDPRWASVGFDERFHIRVRVTFRCADWRLQRRDRDGRRENSIDRRDLRRYRVEFMKPADSALAGRVHR